MFTDATKNAKECPVCMAIHNEEIHEATLRVHEWFHGQVTQGFWEEIEMTEAELLELQCAS